MKLNAFFASVLIVLILFFTVAAPKVQAYAFGDPIDIAEYAVLNVRGLTLEWMNRPYDDYVFWAENIDSHENGMFSHFWGLLASTNYPSIEWTCDYTPNNLNYEQRQTCYEYGYFIAHTITNEWPCDYDC